MRINYLLYLILFFSFSCNAPAEQEVYEKEETKEQNPVLEKTETPAISTAPTKLIINLDNLRLRATAGEKGKEISRLAKGSIVTEAGEVSDFTTAIRLRGIQFDEPWVKVKTEQGVEGWVYGGGVSFSMDNPTELANKLMERRLQTLFKGLAPAILQYQREYSQVKDSKKFAAVYRKGVKLRDTLVTILEQKIPVGDYKQLPDLFWLKEAIPGYIPQLAAEGTLYYLFQDYNKMDLQAKKTNGLDDDNYLDLCLMVHAYDSVEHFFPAWFLQTWDYGGNSLLGQGIHLRILKKMESLVNAGNAFEPEILDLKNNLLNDITWQENAYWEPLDNIKKELKDILAADLSILSKEDIIALETRQKMFDDIKGNKIAVNQKNG